MGESKVVDLRYLADGVVGYLLAVFGDALVVYLAGLDAGGKRAAGKDAAVNQLESLVAVDGLRHLGLKPYAVVVDAVLKAAHSFVGTGEQEMVVVKHGEHNIGGRQRLGADSVAGDGLVHVPLLAVHKRHARGVKHQRVATDAAAVLTALTGNYSRAVEVAFNHFFAIFVHSRLWVLNLRIFGACRRHHTEPALTWRVSRWG